MKEIIHYEYIPPSQPITLSSSFAKFTAVPKKKKKKKKEEEEEEEEEVGTHVDFTSSSSSRWWWWWCIFPYSTFSKVISDQNINTSVAIFTVFA
jgi:hypothetical protein